MGRRGRDRNVPIQCEGVINDGTDLRNIGMAVAISAQNRPGRLVDLGARHRARARARGTGDRDGPVEEGKGRPGAANGTPRRPLGPRLFDYRPSILATM